MKDEIKEIRDYIACPQFGDDHYGKWGALRLDQRIKIKYLLDYITNLQEENERLKEQIKKDNHILGCNFASKDKYKQELEDYKSRNENAVVILNNIYLLDNVSISNNAVEEIDKAINILNGDDEE